MSHFKRPRINSSVLSAKWLQLKRPSAKNRKVQVMSQAVHGAPTPVHSGLPSMGCLGSLKPSWGVIKKCIRNLLYALKRCTFWLLTTRNNNRNVQNYLKSQALLIFPLTLFNFLHKAVRHTQTMPCWAPCETPPQAPRDGRALCWEACDISDSHGGHREYGDGKKITRTGAG